MRRSAVPVPNAQGGTDYVPTLTGGPEGGPSNEPVDEMEQIVGAPTTRPNEPITAGLSSGAGSNVLNINGEEQTLFRKRVAANLKQSPAANAETEAFLKRYLREV